MITISTDNRMKEIAANLKRDVKDLLGENANIVTGFFKQGLCTARGAATRWQNFTRDISGVVSNLFRPFQNNPQPELAPERQPTVTVLSSADENLPTGTRMTLSEAETRISELNESYWNTDELEHPVKVAIDYMMEGETDRYCLPLYTRAGCGSMLEQMQAHVETHLEHPEITTQLFDEAPAGLSQLLHEQFGPQLYDDVEKLATKVIGFFQQHCTIAKMEQQFEKQAQAMPEREQAKFLETMRANVAELRRAANTGRIAEPAQERPAPATPAHQPKREADPKPRRSVKVQLRQIKEGQTPKPVQRKGHTEPQR